MQKIRSLVSRGNSLHSGVSTIVKILLVAVIPILIILITAGMYFLNLKNRKPSGGENLPSVVTESEISPWGYSDKLLTSSPVAPTLSELDSKYKQVVAAIEARDYKAFKAVASAERIWHIDNPKKLIGESKEGDVLDEALSPKGEENFTRYASYSILFNAPNYSDITPKTVSLTQPSSRSNLILEDPTSGQKQKIIMSVWAYSYEIVYEINAGLPDSGFGHVSFVWDKDAWKYNGEYWEIKEHQNNLPLNLGYTATPAKFSVKYYNGDCLPSSLNIAQGDAVSFQNIHGRVYSIVPSSVQWDSGFFYGDNFVKVFDTKGTYNYLIQSPPTEPENAKVCTINVK